MGVGEVGGVRGSGGGAATSEVYVGQIHHSLSTLPDSQSIQAGAGPLYGLGWA